MVLDKYEKLLNLSKEIVDNHEKEMTKVGGIFNVFNIFKIESQEDIHRKFIYNLINPEGTHKQGYLFLIFFIKDVLKKENFNFENVTVEQEKTIKNGRLDLFIENIDYKIAVEIKIYAEESKNQIAKYKKYLDKENNGKKNEVYLLNLYGDESESANGEEHIVISFDIDIKKWLNNCIEATKTITRINEILKQYLENIVYLTENIESILKIELKELLRKDNNLQDVDKLIEENENKYIKELIAMSVELKNDISEEFWEEFEKTIYKKLLDMGFKFSYFLNSGVQYNSVRNEMLIQINSGKEYRAKKILFYIGGLENDLLKNIQEKSNFHFRKAGNGLFSVTDIDFYNNIIYKAKNKKGKEKSANGLKEKVVLILDELEKILK